MSPKSYNDSTMLTQEDIQKLVEVLATKDDVREIKQDLDGLRESV